MENNKTYEMKMPFGKYRNQDIIKVIEDENYKNWLMKQLFFKNDYNKIYQYIKNYKKPINLFEMIEKNLSNDILSIVSEKLKCNNGISSWGMNTTEIKDKEFAKEQKIKLLHKANILEYLNKVNNNKYNIDFIKNRIHIYTIRNCITDKQQKFICNCNGIIWNWNDQQDIRNRIKQEIYEELNIYDLLKKTKINFGKFKNNNLFDLIYNDNIKNVNTNKYENRYKIDDYLNWLNKQENKNNNLINILNIIDIKKILDCNYRCCYN